MLILGTKAAGGSPNPPKQARCPQPPCPGAAPPEGRESPASGTGSGSKAGEPGTGAGTGSAPLPAARRRSPPAERPAGCHGDGREARPVRSAGSPEPERAGGAGTRERSMEGEKRPRSSPGPSAPPGPQRLHRPGAFSRFFSACCKQIAGSRKEIESRLAIKRETNGAFCLLSV